MIHENTISLSFITFVVIESIQNGDNMIKTWPMISIDLQPLNTRNHYYKTTAIEQCLH